MNVLEGKFNGEGLKIAMVASRFNEFITSKLIGGAEDCLVRHGVADNDITLVWVPGAFEIPVMAKKMAESGEYDAVICLGAVIRGATYHYEMVCNEAAKELHRHQWQQVFRYCLVLLQPIQSSRQSSVQVQKQVTRVMTVQCLRLKWQTHSKS